MNAFMNIDNYVPPKCLSKDEAIWALTKLQLALKDWNDWSCKNEAYGDGWSKSQMDDMDRAERLISQLNSQIKITLLTLK